MQKTNNELKLKKKKEKTSNKIDRINWIRYWYKPLTDFRL